MARIVREIVKLLALGSLRSEPLHTYELRKRMQSCVGHFYKVTDGTLYPLLRSLQERDMVASVVEHAENHPDRVVYSITPAGEAEFERLVNEPISASGGDVEFYARVVFLDEMSQKSSRALLAARRERVERELEAVERHPVLDLSFGHTALFGLRALQLKAEREWLDTLDS